MLIEILIKLYYLLNIYFVINIYVTLRNLKHYIKFQKNDLKKFTFLKWKKETYNIDIKNIRSLFISGKI